MITIGSSWTVDVDDFTASEIGGHALAIPLVKGSIVLVLDPKDLPRDPTPHTRVRFADTATWKKYWLFEKVFKRDCKRRP